MAHAVSSPSAPYSFGQFIRSTMQNWTDASAKRRAYQQTRRELLALDDAMLADLGLTRSGVDRAALEAAIGSSKH